MHRLIIISILALIPSLAFAGWDQSTVIGPELVPIYGAPTTDPNTGQPYTPIVGYQALPTYPNPYCVLVPASFVTPALQPYAHDPPPGVPVLEGVPTKAICTPDEATARALPYLAMHWTDSSIVP